MTEEEEVRVVALLRQHAADVWPNGADFGGCRCGWAPEGDPRHGKFDLADHQARLIRNLLGHER